MWIKILTIIACLIATSVYAQRPQPTRAPATVPTIVTEEPIDTSVIGQEGCLGRLALQIQSSNTTRNFLVVPKRGHRRSFESRYPGLKIQSSDGSGRGVPVTVVNDVKEAEMVRNVAIKTLHG